jgi:hypothetical protein
MRRFFTLLAALAFTITVFGQKSDTLVPHKGTLLLGLGLGVKSHLGNVGVTSNFFLSRAFNIKFSVGWGLFNYNGFLLSIGPEYCRQIKDNKFLLLGSVFTIASGISDVIDDRSPGRRAYNISPGALYSRTYAGIKFNTKDGILKIEMGYSYVLNTPAYVLDGPGVWTSKEIRNIEKAIGSGFLISFTTQGFFTKNKTE